MELDRVRTVTRADSGLSGSGLVLSLATDQGPGGVSSRGRTAPGTAR